MVFKVKSIIEVQLRIDKIDLRKFLYKRKISDFNTLLCSCREKDQSVYYVLLMCSKWMQKRWEIIKHIKYWDLIKLLKELNILRITINIILKTKLLEQFSKVREVLRSVIWVMF